MTAHDRGEEAKQEGGTGHANAPGAGGRRRAGGLGKDRMSGRAGLTKNAREDGGQAPAGAKKTAARGWGTKEVQKKCGHRPLESVPAGMLRYQSLLGVRSWCTAGCFLGGFPTRRAGRR